MQVIKRDGRISEYNDERIIKAITLAMSHTTGGVDIDLATKIADSVRNQLKDKVQVSVYEIQDIVEKKLMGSSRKEVAQEYITYRYNRDVARKAKSKDMFLEIIETKSNDVTRENANMNADTPAGMMMKFASETTKPFVDDFLLSTEARTAIKNGYIHIHDKDYYPTKSLTCLQHPLDKILEHGFRAGHGSSRPAKRIETASIIGCISLETVQNEMHYAVHGNTAAEVIFNRVDSKKENIGLTNFKGNMPTRAETEIAKNYLSEKELDLLNRMVSAYLDVAEINALNMHAMTMKDWVKELNGFLTMTHKDILEGAGTISHEKALEKAHKEYDKYMKSHLKNVHISYKSRLIFVKYSVII